MSRTQAQPTKATYVRRRLVAAIVVLLPVLLGVRACTAATADPVPTPATKTTPTSTTAASATPSPTVSSTPKVSATPSTGACDNGSIEVQVSTDKQNYRLGENVVLQMRIVNTGGIECRRDVGALPNEMYIMDADDVVVWTSDACQTSARGEIVTMKPGAAFGNTQTWTGSNTGRGCSSLSADAAAGEYRAFARNDTVVSAPATFTLD